jgi:hypothetical protein
MTDIEIVYNCVHDKTYQDKLELELICEKVQDKKLVKGLLTQLYSNDKGYEIDKNIPVELMASLFGSTPDKDELFSASEYYGKLMKELNDFTLNKNKFLVEFLSEMKSSIESEEGQEVTEKDIDTEKLDQILTSCEDKRYIEYVKYTLLEYEMYEFIKIVDKYLN